MKVLFISHDASRTGAPLALLSLLREIKDERLDNPITADVLLLEDGELRDDFASVSSHVFKAFSSKHRGIWGKIKGRILRILHLKQAWQYSVMRNKYDLIYANTVVSLPVACYIQQHDDTPLVLHIHESEYLLQTLLSDVSLLNRCDRILTVSPMMRDVLISKYGVKESMIAIVYPFSSFLNHTQTLNKREKHIQLPSHEFIVGLVGSSDVWLKGADLLPLVIKSLIDKQPDADIHFVWVGQLYGEAGKQLKYDLDKCGLSGYVSCLGVVDNPIPVYAQFDMLLVLSRGESFSLTCMECAHLGKPIVCMDSAVGMAGLLVPDAIMAVPYLSVEALSDAVLSLYLDRDMAAQLGQNAHDRVQGLFSLKNNVKLIIQEMLNVTQ